jgi:hypothetical protein
MIIRRRHGLITSTTRAALYRTLKSKEVARVTRAGIKMEFRISNQPTFEGDRVQWKARVKKQWQHGTASSIADAAEQIERIAAEWPDHQE